MSDDATTRDAEAILARHGKSFRFASRFMEPGDARDAALLYRVCRELDDLADQEMPTEAQNRDAHRRLAQVREELVNDRGNDLLSRLLLDLQRRRGLDTRAAVALIDALIEDVESPALIVDETRLLRYCYGVAGAVGVLMCPVVGAPQSATPHGIDLGLAMQMTNIARDVREDAEMGRRYLPADWVEGMTPADIATADERQQMLVSGAIDRLLSLAERYYASAADGFVAIPGRNRRAIAVAADVYRAIGWRLYRQRLAWWQGRVVVPLPTKLWLATRRGLGRGAIRAAGRNDHDASLHRAIADLPGAHDAAGISRVDPRLLAADSAIHE
ncbi:phytoene/squalene synthase family protein [Kushneria aurantia]|uniref:Phytoene/squalene synthase family protein n=1 Tax=Kushneria aurantia TaxID=504092 RepID=A0ABV6G3Y7_9GAMM|nr:squalene/phytoene synthase family protein [Kushneria aurantia]